MLTSTSEQLKIPNLENIVDRYEQRDAFTDVIERMRSNMPFQHNLFEWYGAPGIGKTTLVALLKHECEKRDIPFVGINFDLDDEEESKSRSFFKDPVLLVDEIVASLSKYNPDTTFVKMQIDKYHETQLPEEGICVAYARMTERERAYSNQDWLLNMRLVLSELMGIISKLTTEDENGQIQPFVLFVDAVNKVSDLLADWIEEFLVKPIVQTKQSVVVWTARHPWKWKRPEIRWDRKSEELRTFNQAEVKLQVMNSLRHRTENTLVEQLFKNIYSLTGGHPFAGAVVIDEIGHWKSINTDELKQQEKILHREIHRHVITNYAFKNLSLEQRTALELCSMIRLIDTTTIQQILQECASAMFESWSRKDFDRLMFELRRTYLLRWERSGWTLEPSLRRLMRSYYLVCAEETFRKVNLVALSVYQGWLSRPVDNRKLFIIEELYHYISLQQVNIKDKNLVEVLLERLEQYPSLVKQDLDSWRITLEQIEGEIEHDNEFAQLLGEDEIKRLTDPIKTQMKQLMEQKSE